MLQPILSNNESSMYYCDSCWNDNYVEPTRTVSACPTPPAPKNVNGCDDAYMSFSQCSMNSTITNKLDVCANAGLRTLSSHECRYYESSGPQCYCDQYKVYMSCYQQYCPGLMHPSTNDCFSKIVSLDYVCGPAYSSCWRGPSTIGIPNSPICTFIH
mgnify:CR=1 FL=1